MTFTQRSWSDKPTSRSLPAIPDRKMTMSKNWKARSLTVVAATGAAVVMATGIGYAFWSASGTGVGSAAAGTVVPVTANVTTVQSSATLLYPGVSVPATINVHNPNPVAVKVTGYTLATATQPTGVSNPSNASCTVTSALVSAATATASGLNVSIPANSDITITPAGNLITMGANSDSGCQGATFTFSGVTVVAQVG